MTPDFAISFQNKEEESRSSKLCFFKNQKNLQKVQIF